VSQPARPVTELPRSVPVGLARTTLRAVQRVRTSVVFGLVLLLFAALMARLVKLQLLGGPAFRGMVSRQGSDDRVVPLRGAVLDRESRPLALSRPVRTVFVEAGGVVNPRTDTLTLTIDDVGRFAMTLSELLEGVPTAKELRAALERAIAAAEFEEAQVRGKGAVPRLAPTA
jgi:cell division protein FtsI/penicillin-binding protein 2